MGVNAVAQGCCQLVWHSSTEEQGRQFTLNTAAVHWCLVTADLYAEWIFKGCSDTNLLSAGLAQQHRRTRQAMYPKHCNSALVSGDCRSV